MYFSKIKFLLGTNIEITIISEDRKTPDRIEYVFDYFSSIEREFSRFHPDSALSLLNKEKTLSVSHRFIELISLAKEKFEQTKGLFNPLVYVSNLGYSHSFEDGKFEKTDTLIDTDFSQVVIGENEVSIGKNQLLDFGGIAKGYAVDKASEILLLFGYDNFFINAGGDISAHGVNQTNAPWTIGVENPFTFEIEAYLSLKNSAIATSGRYRRKWDIDGKSYHHLIDPRTGENQNALMSVTLIGERCVDCDSMTKYIFNIPPTEGIGKMEENAMNGLIYTAEGHLLYTKDLVKKYDFHIREVA